jgi:stress-induced morphogen
MMRVLARFCNSKQTREIQYADKLKQTLQATFVQVKDTTVGGGCGQMYTIQVESPLFRGKSLVQQHKMVNDALKAEIEGIHGFTLKTRVPK